MKFKLDQRVHYANHFWTINGVTAADEKIFALSLVRETVYDGKPQKIEITVRGSELSKVEKS